MGVNPSSLSPALISSQSMGFSPPLTRKDGRVIEADDSLVKEVAGDLLLRDGMSYGFHYVTTASEEDLKKKGKPVVIFLHGTGFNWSSWLDQMKYFKNQGVDVISFDLPGHNGSQFENLDDYSFSEISKKIHDEVLPEITSRKYVVVAHDLGGGIGLEIAYRYANNMAKDPNYLGYAAINAPDASVLFPAMAEHKLKSYSRFVKLFANHPRFSGFLFSKAPQNLLGYKKENKSEISKEELQLVQRPLLNDPAAHYLWYYQNRENEVFYQDEKDKSGGDLETLKLEGLKIGIPVLFIGSTDDPFLENTVLEKPDLNLIPDAQLEKIESGHTPQLEKPDDVNGYLWDFYRKVSGT